MVQKRKTGKRLLAMLLCALTVVLSCPFAASAASVGVTTAYVNLRSGAGLNYGVMETVALGAQVTVNNTSNASWYNVTAPSGRTGYMSADYIRLVGDTSNAVSGRTTAYVHLRTGAGTNTASMMVVPQGATVSVLDRSNSQWYRVQYSNRVGYMFAQYITITGATATATPRPTATATPKPTTAATATPRPTATATATPSSTLSGTTTAWVNLRAGASTSTRVYLTVPLGATISVLDRSNSSWYRVSYQNYTGYMSAQYIRVSTPAAATPTPTPVPSAIGTARTTAVLNIRTGPSTSYQSRGLLANGVTVTVLEKCSNGWYGVRTAANLTGYCSGDYLRVTLNAQATATPTATPTAKPTATPTTAPTATPTAAPTTAPTTVTGRTTADLNLRENAGTYYDVLRVVSRNTTVTILEKTNAGWYKVRLANGTEGYFSTDYVQIVSGDVAAITKPEISTANMTEAEKRAKSVLDSVGWDLKAAFLWSAQRLPYQTLSYSAANGHVHSEWYANYGFTNMRGNCYVMASTFYKMAKLLGYDAHFTEGYVKTNSGGNSPHGWVEIIINGTTYVFDPDFQHEYGRNGYQITYGASGTFRYVDYKWVD